MRQKDDIFVINCNQYTTRLFKTKIKHWTNLWLFSRLDEFLAIVLISFGNITYPWKITACKKMSKSTQILGLPQYIILTVSFEMCKEAHCLFIHKTHQVFLISHVQAYRSTDQIYFWDPIKKIDKPLQKLIFKKVRMFAAILQKERGFCNIFSIMYIPISCHSDQIFSVD